MSSWSVLMRDRIRRVAKAIWIAVLVAPCGAVHAATQSTQALDELAAVLPKQMRAAVLVANLNRSSDALVTLLEGMDRANLLIGSRPSDQIKSTLQLSVAVDDLSGGGVVLVPGVTGEPEAENENDDPSKTLIAIGVVPVTSLKQFISGNFTVDSGELDGVSRELSGASQSFSHPFMGTLYLRSINNHVIFSRDQRAVNTYEPIGAGQVAEKSSAKHLRRRFGDDAWQALAEGHLFVYSEQESLHTLMRQARTTIEQDNGSGSVSTWLALFRFIERQSASPMVSALTDAGRGGVVVFRFDPLGLFVRTYWNLAEHCPVAQRAEAGFSPSASVAPLPAARYFIAASFNAPMLAAMLPANETDADAPESFTNLYRALKSARALHVHASPHPAGFGEGFLAHTGIVIETDDPAIVREATKKDMNALNSDSQDSAADVTWEADVPVSDDIRADAFRVEISNDRIERASRRVLQEYLFGPGSVSGYVWRDESTVIITTTQRNQSLVNMIQALRGRGNTLGDDPIVATMRNWMPEDRVMEMYIQPDEMLRALRHTPLGFAMPEPLRARLNSDLTPIGFGAQVTGSQARTITIIPADTLTLALDTFRRPSGVGTRSQN